MRIMLHEYANGGRHAFETSDDGDYVGEWTGPRQVGERICAFIELACATTPEGIDRLIEAMDWLTQEIEKRKESATKAAR